MPNLIRRKTKAGTLYTHYEGCQTGLDFPAVLFPGAVCPVLDFGPGDTVYKLGDTVIIKGFLKHDNKFAEFASDIHTSKVQLIYKLYCGPDLMVEDSRNQIPVTLKFPTARVSYNLSKGWTRATLSMLYTKLEDLKVTMQACFGIETA